MKKLLAALLAISITAALAGCGKPADEQLIDDITEDTSLVTEATETTSKSVSATITTTTTTSAETSTETVSETEETTKQVTEMIRETTKAITETNGTSAETTAEIVSESQLSFADYDAEKFPMGVWQDNYVFTYECDEYGNITYNYYDENDTVIYSGSFKNYTESDNQIYNEISKKDSNIYEFDGEGHFRISLRTHNVFGEYTFEDNMLTLIFEFEFNDETFINRFCFEASQNENGYRLEFMPSQSTEMIEMPAVQDMERSYFEGFVGLSALFDTFYVRKPFLIEYIDDTNADNFKSYIEYINSIS